MRVLLDSTVLIDALRGSPVTQRIRVMPATGDIPCTTGVNVEEVVRGLRPREIDHAERLFGGLDVIPIGRPEGWQAGTWRREFARKGVTLSQPDCLVAAAALAAGAKLVTGNPKHFPMKEIDVEHWPAGR